MASLYKWLVLWTVDILFCPNQLLNTCVIDLLLVRPNKKISVFPVTGLNILGRESTHFLCRLQSMVNTYGSCLRRCRHRPRCHTLGFQSITLEGMHQFHSNFTEGSSIIKYKSSMKGGFPLFFLLSYGPFLT